MHFLSTQHFRGFISVLFPNVNKNKHCNIITHILKKIYFIVAYIINKNNNTCSIVLYYHSNLPIITTFLFTHILILCSHHKPHCSILLRSDLSISNFHIRNSKWCKWSVSNFYVLLWGINRSSAPFLFFCTAGALTICSSLVENSPDGKE